MSFILSCVLHVIVCGNVVMLLGAQGTVGNTGNAMANVCASESHRSKYQRSIIRVSRGIFNQT